MSKIDRDQFLRNSLAYKHFLLLQPSEIWCLMRKKTSFHSTFGDCIRSALEHPDSFCGLYACDGDCYELFRCLFWPLIMDFHHIDLRTFSFKHDFGDIQQISEWTSEMNERIVSIRLRLSRSIQGYPMVPKLTLEQFIELEDRIRPICVKFEKDLQGQYRSLRDIEENEREKLRDQQTLFSVMTNFFRGVAENVSLLRLGAV